VVRGVGKSPSMGRSTLECDSTAGGWYVVNRTLGSWPEAMWYGFLDRLALGGRMRTRLWSLYHRARGSRSCRGCQSGGGTSHDRACPSSMVTRSVHGAIPVKEHPQQAECNGRETRGGCVDRILVETIVCYMRRTHIRRLII
jgi:hypothetical protein